MDNILLRVLWNHLISIANEQARALRRTAFSPVVREAGDVAVAVLDRRGRLVANAVTGAPGHINTMRTAGEHFIEAFPPETLKPGDQLITNDPWQASAHFFDIAVFSPIFYRLMITVHNLSASRLLRQPLCISVTPRGDCS